MNNSRKRISILKPKYKKVLEASLSVSLIFIAFLFYSFKSFDHEMKLQISFVFRNSHPELIKYLNETRNTKYE